MALTPEQQKTIRVARVAYKNMLEERLGPALKEYVDMLNRVKELHRNAPWAPKPKPQPAPQVDPAEQKMLEEVLAEASKKKETK
jgi:hypothetical protein